MQFKEALQMQLDVQRRLHEQLEVNMVHGLLIMYANKSFPCPETQQLHFPSMSRYREICS